MMSFLVMVGEWGDGIEKMLSIPTLTISQWHISAGITA
jgi:hypothetical protein